MPLLPWSSRKSRDQVEETIVELDVNANYLEEFNFADQLSSYKNQQCMLDESLSQFDDLKGIMNPVNPRLKFKLMDQIGSGDNWQLFNAIDEQTNRKVIIKIVQTNKVAVQEYLNNFKNKRHPNLLDYLDSHLTALDDESFQLWIVMKHVKFGSLKSLMEQNFKVNYCESYIAIIVCEILKAINFMQKNRIIHRQVKSDNVLMDGSGQIKLIAFNPCDEFAAEPSTNRSEPNGIFSDHQMKTNIWSLGLLIIELLEDEHCRTALDRNSMDERPEINYDRFSLQLADFLDHCLTMDSELRAKAADLLDHEFLKFVKPLHALANLVEHQLAMNNKLSTGSH